MSLQSDKSHKCHCKASCKDVMHCIVVLITKMAPRCEISSCIFVLDYNTLGLLLAMHFMVTRVAWETRGGWEDHDAPSTLAPYIYLLTLFLTIPSPPKHQFSPKNYCASLPWLHKQGHSQQINPPIQRNQGKTITLNSWKLKPYQLVFVNCWNYKWTLRLLPPMRIVTYDSFSTLIYIVGNAMHTEFSRNFPTTT